MKNLMWVMLAVLISSLAQVTAQAAPAQILIIRHAEKPAQGPELSAKGQARARGLVDFFRLNPSVTEFGTPIAIYAAAPRKADNSVRPIETVKPLAQSLGFTLNVNYDKTDIQAVVDEILNAPEYDGKMVLICWVHDAIPELVGAFGVVPTPAEWPHKSFDRVWKINFVDSRPQRLIDLPQRVLPGDSN